MSSPGTNPDGSLLTDELIDLREANHGLHEPSPARGDDGALRLFIAAAESIVATGQRVNYPNAEAMMRDVASRTLEACFELNVGACPSAQSAPALQAMASYVRTCDLDELDSAYTQLLSCEPRIETATSTIRFVPGRGEARRALGAWYTPQVIISAICDVALDPVIERAKNSQNPIEMLGRIRVIDPACGSGRFLIEAARRLNRAYDEVHPLKAAATANAVSVNGVVEDSVQIEAAQRRARIVAQSIFGCDVDNGAAVLCRTRLASYIRAGDAQSLEIAHDKVYVGDSLTGSLFDDEKLARGSFDVVLGNPPFLTPLSARATRDRKRAGVLREKFGDLAKGYVDASALFLLLGLQLARPDSGVVALVQPASLLSAAHALKLRNKLLTQAYLRWIWLTEEPMFDASVRTAAVVLETSAHLDNKSSYALSRHLGSDFKQLDPSQVSLDDLSHSATWAHLVSDGLGIPNADLPRTRLLEEVVEASADFRDQYYGLVGKVVEHAEVADQIAVDGEKMYPKLVTSGLVDPLHLLWGERSTTFHKKRFENPRVDRKAVSTNARLRDWLDSRLRPKVILATQTRVLEAVVDSEGVCVPSVPVISLVCKDDKVWHVAALLHAPLISAWAARRVIGSAMSLSALKLSATQVRVLPIPNDCQSWDQAADLNQQASQEADLDKRITLLSDAGWKMAEAFGVSEAVARESHEWWLSRIMPNASRR